MSKSKPPRVRFRNARITTTKTRPHTVVADAYELAATIGLPPEMAEEAADVLLGRRTKWGADAVIIWRGDGDELCVPDDLLADMIAHRLWAERLQELVLGRRRHNAAVAVRRAERERLSECLVEPEKLTDEELREAAELERKYRSTTTLQRELGDRQAVKARAVAEDRERLRAERLAGRPDVVDVEMRRLCASCGKRDARVDDLCKRCAYDAGLIIHGKIGTVVDPAPNLKRKHRP